ncbi:unnamed protein product [Ceutorhynchus assimilis]|uniref:F-box domain-containing protein n=1 Tax=Ceutorhynchus assimilis TaxID=467358 RepID=A0A9N9MUI2_9CUCU|nr:unnamed protein product [Ceutorhynchus assimilis]
MDFTPKNDDSSQMSSYDMSPKIYESTPKTETESTPHSLYNNHKKRKIQYCDIKGRKLEDLLELGSNSPQASSTLNDSLTNKFENIQIEKNCFNIESCEERSQKYFKTNGCERLVTPPSTPEFQRFEHTARNTPLFQRCSTSACSVPSPLKEQHDILYPTLKSLEPMKKPLTPQKFKEKIGQNSTPLATRFIPQDNLLKKVLGNNLIMGKVFEYLSNGDLFRVCMVSTDFKNAVHTNYKATLRCGNYKQFHRTNKENYKITPPSSPESNNLFPEGSVSPNSQKFAEFAETAHNIFPTQSLIKCPKCDRPSVVENSIAQCTEGHSCGYIFCQKCFSFSYNPEEFYDRCQDLALSNSMLKKRSRLEDLTNCSADFNVSAILNSTVDNHLSSGYFSASGYDTSHTPQSVKRNLVNSLGGNDSLLQKERKALFNSNTSLNMSAIVMARREEKRRCSSGNIMPIVKLETVKKRIEMIEPSSPPKVKPYSACSKESRRSLKRLTR